MQVSTKRVVCVELVQNGTPEAELQWQVPLVAIRSVDLKNMPLVLTFEIDHSSAAAKPSAAAGGVAEEKESSTGTTGVRRDGSLVNGGRAWGQAEEKIVYKRLFGDWQMDNVALMRIYNLVNCLLGKIDE